MPMGPGRDAQDERMNRSRWRNSPGRLWAGGLNMGMGTAGSKWDRLERVAGWAFIIGWALVLIGGFIPRG